MDVENFKGYDVGEVAERIYENLIKPSEHFYRGVEFVVEGEDNAKEIMMGVQELEGSQGLFEYEVREMMCLLNKESCGEERYKVIINWKK